MPTRNSKMEVDYYVAMDYDNVDEMFMMDEFCRLSLHFKIPFQLYTSSENSYHIRSNKPLSQEMCLYIMNYSRCSYDYKAYCNRLGYCPIRDTAKPVWKDGQIEEIKAKPVCILTNKLSYNICNNSNNSRD